MHHITMSIKNDKFQLFQFNSPREIKSYHCNKTPEEGTNSQKRTHL